MRFIGTLQVLLGFVMVFASATRALDAQSVYIPAGVIDENDAVLTIKPSATDHTIAASDFAHVVIYDRKARAGNILLFLPGTGGRPPGPIRFFERAVERGYRAIYLSYIDEPAVSQVCVGPALHSDSDCARHFREKRTYGIDDTSLISDAPQDAIANRFAKLLQYLSRPIEMVGGNSIWTVARRFGVASPLPASRKAVEWRSSSASAKWSGA